MQPVLQSWQLIQEEAIGDFVTQLHTSTDENFLMIMISMQLAALDSIQKDMIVTQY